MYLPMLVEYNIRDHLHVFDTKFIAITRPSLLNHNFFLQLKEAQVFLVA